MHLPLFLSVLLLTLSACVSQAEYGAVRAERDDYRQQNIAADSLAGSLRQRYGEDSLSSNDDPSISQFRRIDELTATNLRLKEQYDLLNRQYETLLDQHSNMLPTGSGDLQRQLIEREATLKSEEEKLSKREDEITRRERSISTALTAAGRENNLGKISSATQESTATVTATQVAGEVEQVLKSTLDEGYSVTNPADGRISISINNDLLYDDRQNLGSDGEVLVRKLVSTLRDSRGANYTIVAHAGAAEGNADAAYRVSSRRAVNLAIQLARFGLDPATITAGAQGYFGAENQRTLINVDYRDLP